jgi:hypothetical protein
MIVRGRIVFDNGASWAFDESNYESVIQSLTEEQRHSMARLLLGKLGPRNEHPFDPEVFECWYEDTHRKDLIMGGSSSNSDSKINKKGGKKYSLKEWKNMSEAEKNLKWAKMNGVKLKWNKDKGYTYTLRGQELNVVWFDELTHEEFKGRIGLL